MNENFRRKYNLIEDVDTWKRGYQEIIAMAGIYKIVAYHKIKFEWSENLELRDGEGVAVRVCASMKDGKSKKTETMFGEANKFNCKVPYYWAMALNRGKARAVLMLIGAYGKKGYYMEEEAEAFEKKNPTLKEINYYVSLTKDAKELGLLSVTDQAYFREHDVEIRNNLNFWKSEVDKLERLLKGESNDIES